MKILGQLLLTAMAPVVVVVLAAAGVPLVAVILVVVVPAFIWPMHAIDHLGYR